VLCAPLNRPYGEVKIELLASSAGISVVLRVDPPINESRHASVLLPATLTTSCFRGPIVGLEASGPKSRRPSVESSAQFLRILQSILHPAPSGITSITLNLHPRSKFPSPWTFLDLMAVLPLRFLVRKKGAQKV
jgi:hypothetical protein